MHEEFHKGINEIVDSLRVSADEKDLYAAHYTSVITPRLLLDGDGTNNRLRQYAADYMNDPEEGRFVFDIMIEAASKSKHPLGGVLVEYLSEIRKNRLLYSAINSATFLSCWTKTYIKEGEESGCDSLNHWRFYGQDGAGACIIVPIKQLRENFGDQLFAVQYGKSLRGGGSGAQNRPIIKIRKLLEKRFSNLRKTEANLIKDLDELIKSVMPLLFLFKSESYSSEQEVRTIMQTANYGSQSDVIFDDRDPRRAYVNGGDGLLSNGGIVLFGPKSDTAYAVELLGLISKTQRDIKVFMSEIKYR
ncbi:DUF2971 domain-containing protein [Neogemmobacter tilapiae]|nr:DUF2971 domain-containing protein [Gemmobacter tilapiae]